MKVKGTVKGSKMIKGDILDVAKNLVNEGTASSVTSAIVNIKNAIRGEEPRKSHSKRYTAYGRKWEIVSK